jgi:hypothetical protein
MRGFVLVGVCLFAAVAVQAQQGGPAQVVGEFSSIYDQYKHRRHLPNCPSEAEAAPRIFHALDLWEHQSGKVMERIRTVSEMPGFPRRELNIYFIACGRSISSPVTVAVYKGGPEGPFIPLTDEELLTDIAHEILHNVANSPAYADARYFAGTAYADEAADARNHVIVAALETRLVGYDALRRRYAGNRDYARALELAMKFGLGSREPWD